MILESQNEEVQVEVIRNVLSTSQASKIIKMLDFGEKSQIYQEINKKVIESTMRYYLSEV
jgi:hypothetical protein